MSYAMYHIDLSVRYITFTLHVYQPALKPGGGGPDGGLTGHEAAKSVTAVPVCV